MIQLEENRLQEVHRSKLKSYMEGDSDLGSPVKLFHFKQARQDSTTGIDEWNVEKVLSHRKLANGELEFRVKWETSPELTWEPLHHFFHRYSQPIVDYFREKGIKEDVMAHLAKHPPEATAAIAAVLAAKDKAEELSMDYEEPPVEWCWDDQIEKVL